MEKDNSSIKKKVKIFRNQKFRLWSSVPIAVSSCPAAAHMNR